MVVGNETTTGKLKIRDKVLDVLEFYVRRMYEVITNYQRIERPREKYKHYHSAALVLEAILDDIENEIEVEGD